MRKRDEDLHRIHDGELAGPAPRLDADDRLRLEAMSDLGALVRNTLSVETPRIDAWAEIERRIGGAPQTTAATTTATTEAARRQTESKQQAMRAWRHRLRRRALMTLPVVAAVAAAVVLWFNTGRAAATNGCDIELLDVSGAAAAVIQVPDRDGKGSTTVIWTTED